MIKNRMFLEKAKAKIKSVLLISAVFTGLGVLFACSEDETNKGTGVGELKVILATDSDVNAVTRAVTEQDPNAPGVNDFTINISRSGYTKDFSYSELSETIELEAGTYEVKAVSGSTTTEGFVGKDEYTAPWYQASETIVIEAEKTTPATLSATLQNAKVSVTYTEKFLAYFDDYKWSVLLQANNGTIFNYNMGESYDPLYLFPGDLKVEIYVSEQEGGVVSEVKKEMSIQAAKHYMLRFDTDGEIDMNGNASFKVTFVAPEEEAIEINLAAIPVLTTSESFVNNIYEIPAGNTYPDAYISISGRGEMTICSLTTSQGDITYNLLDSAVVSELKEEKGINFTINENSTLAVLNLSCFISYMKEQGITEYKYILDVENTAGYKSSVEVTIKNN